MKQSKRPVTKAIQRLPDSCRVLFTFDDYSEFSNSLRNKNLLWQDLHQLSEMKGSEKYFRYFDSLLLANEFFNDLQDKNTVHLGFYNKNDFLICCNMTEMDDEKKCDEQIKALETDFRKKSLFAKVGEGALAFSNSQELIGIYFDATKRKLVDNPAFASLKNSANYSGTGIYISPSFKIPFLSGTYSSLNIKPDRLVLNGVKQNQSTADYFSEGSALIASAEFLNRIPLLCNSFKAFAVSEAGKYFDAKAKDDWWLTVNDEALFNAKNQFYDQINGVITEAEMPSGEKALILNCADSSKMAEIFPFILDSTKLAQARIFALKKQKNSFSSSTFGKLKLNDFSFITVFKDYFVLTANFSDAEIFVNANMIGSSIMDNKSFRQFASKNFDTEINFIDYSKVNALNRKDLPFGGFITDSDMVCLRNTSHCSYSALLKNGKLNFRFNLSYSQENASDEPGVLWVLNNEKKVVSGPFIFKNHLTKGNEIVFQDENKDLCLQNATGKILWRKKLNEEVQSSVQTVDAFRNGKFQMLFNTDNYLYLVDRNGNDVQGYPVKLPAKASNRISVLDYDNKNELRIFIACADKKIYNYSIWGVKQEGFRPVATMDEVILPVKYCKVGLSDYLVTADKKGRVYAFSRKGDGRIDFKNKTVEDALDFEIETGNLLVNTHIVYYDKAGHLINKISLADKKEVYKVHERENAICFADFDNNRITDVLLASENKLEAYNFNGARIFALDKNMEMKPDRLSFYRFGQRSFVCMSDWEEGKVKIYDKEDKSEKNFNSAQNPLLCDLFNDGKIYVLLVNGNEIKCLKL